MQPIIAKQILPWFGGSAAVWTTCLVFFQSVLLVGYAYADLDHAPRAAPPGDAARGAARAVARLPADHRLDAAGSRRATSSRSRASCSCWSATIGLPYFLLSTTTPLLQAWYWRRFQRAVPYRLFALSNFASLLALLGFPLLFEPAFDLNQLGWGWSFAVRRLRAAVRGHGLAVR